MKNTIISSLILLLAAAAPLQAAILLVPGEYPTIQAAIDAANPGDKVIITPGIYTGPGNWDISFEGKAITVQSGNPDDPNIVARTIIDCNEIDYGGTMGKGFPVQGRLPHYGFSFENGEDANSILDGVTIINGIGYHQEGGGITCVNSAPTIKNCTIKYCISDNYGGGILCWGGHESSFPYYNDHPKIINCTISHNQSRLSGAGIYCNSYDYGSGPTITNCIISNNTISPPAYSWPPPPVRYGGGVYCASLSNTTITNCIIKDNSADCGGGIYSKSGDLKITNCIIRGNRADFGGAIYYDSDSRPIVTNCVISSNSAQLDGGGVYSLYRYNSPMKFTNCTIAANTAGRFGGGLLSDYPSLSISVVNSIFWGNRDSTGTGQSAQISLPEYDPRWDRGGAGIEFICIQDNISNDGNVPFNYPDWFFGGVRRTIGSYTNIDSDPMFVHNPDDGGDGWGDDPNTAGLNEGANDDFGDLHLRKTSPCINAGMTNYIAEVATDLDGRLRLVGPRIDMGVYEYPTMIEVTNPKGGEVWADASTHEINWKSYGVTGLVNILSSTDGGINWKAVGSADISTDKYSWHLPDGIDSNQCVISVVPKTPDVNVLCVNSGAFEINPFYPFEGKQPNNKPQPDIGPTTVCIKWQFRTAGPVTAAVTAINKKVYVPCEDGKLYVLNQDDGKLLWSYDAKSPLVASAGVAHHGMVYAADTKGKLHTLNAQGQLQWIYDTYGAIQATPVISRYNNIYLCSQDGTIYSLAQDGSELWCFDTAGIGQLRGSILATPQIADDGTIYAAGLYDPNLYAINPTDGSIKWTCNFGKNDASAGWPFAPPAIAEDGILYQTLLYDSNLYAIEPEKGKILWSVNLADPCNGWPEPITWTEWWQPISNSHDAYEYLKYSNGWSQPAIGPDGTIYVSLTNPYQLVEDSNGTIWGINGKTYTYVDKSYLLAVNQDGTVKWIIQLGAGGGFTLSVDKTGMIYAASDDNRLYIVDPAGKVISQFEGRGQLSWPVIAENHSLLVSDANNTIWAFSDDACRKTPPAPDNVTKKDRK